MKCGAKRYLVLTEDNGEQQIKTVIARTPAEARKKFRSTYGIKAQIISVKEVKGYNLKS
ncbi:hypothetical protein [Paucisalibacillus sp. EB02]|uniref:hypothetical protein n=1 Tax=Paucisalibacillus sp. EB02 TaxID=1347087 RepID=UPI0018CC1697|nr:hypothetical protein [Paucisalibacillus sp. EB02]